MLDNAEADLSHAHQPDCVDPEPVSVFLEILAFLGSIASIAGYIDFKRVQRQELDASRVKNIREAMDMLMSLEADNMQLQASLQKLEFILVEGTSEHHSLPLEKLRLEFGTCKPLFTLNGFQKYQEVLQELHGIVGRSFDTTHRLLQRLYNLDVRIPDEAQARLLELQRRLNSVLRESLTYEQGFRVYYEIISLSRDVVRNLRNILGGYL